MPRADLALPVLTISTCAPRVNATRTVGQGQSVTELEKFLLARYSLELHLIYYHTCKRLFANRSVESVLQSAGERSSESCRKLALAKPLSANELHPGNVSFAWGNCTPIMLPWKLVRSLAWWLVSVEGSGTHGTGHTWAEQGRTSRPASPAQGGNTSISSPRLAFLGKKTRAAPSSGGTGVPPREGPEVPYVRGLVCVPGAVLGGGSDEQQLWWLPPPWRLILLSCAYEQQRVLLVLCSLLVLILQVGL